MEVNKLEVVQLLEYLQEIINNAAKVPMSGKIMISKKEIMEVTEAPSSMGRCASFSNVSSKLGKSHVNTPFDSAVISSFRRSIPDSCSLFH